MIQDPIVADELADNRPLLEAMRAGVAALSPNAPFLLLPVRIETRFMLVERVDRSLRAGSAPTVTAVIAGRLDHVLRQLTALARIDLATTLGDAPGEAKQSVKKRETIMNRRLHKAARNLRSLGRRLRAPLRDHCAVEAPDRIEQLVDRSRALLDAWTAADANIDRLRSSHLRQRWHERLRALRAEVIEPLRASVERELVPRLRLASELETVAPRDIAAPLRRLGELAGRLARRSPKARDDLSEAERHVEEFALRTRAPLRGSQEELEHVDADLKAIASVLEKAPRASGPGKDAAAHRLEALRDAHARLARPRWRTPQDVDQSARAHLEATELLSELLARLDAREPPPSRLQAHWMDLAGSVIRAASRLAALRRRMTLLPERWRAELDARQARALQGARALPEKLRRLLPLQGPGTHANRLLLKDLDRALASLVANDLRSKADSGRSGHTRDAIVFLRDDPTRREHELQVRIYPDALHVHTHEPGLTEGERQSAQGFWTETKAAGTSDPDLRAAWRALCARHGVRRAAWIARQTSPRRLRSLDGETSVSVLERVERELDRGGAPTVSRLKTAQRWVRAQQKAQAGRTVSLRPWQLERVAGLVTVISAKLEHLSRRDDPRAALATEARRLARLVGELGEATASARSRASEPTLRDTETRESTWEQAPHSNVLPDRFVAVTVQAGKVTHAVVGKPVDPALSLGLDPKAEDFALLPDGKLQVGDSIRWMTDYRTAVEKGMAITIPISPEEAQTRFDQVFVLGYKSVDDVAGKQLVEALLENHHYNANGLAFVPVGSPTNNTDGERTSYVARDDPDAAYAVEREGPLFVPAKTGPAPDGQRFADALGISRDTVTNVAGAAGNDVNEALLVNRALWPATGGAYLQEFWGPLFTRDTERRIGRFFTDHVVARGFLPTLRVGALPYGLLPTTAFGRYLPSTGRTFTPLPTSRPAVQPGPETDLQRREKEVRFNALLPDVLAVLNEDFTRLCAALVHHAVRSPVQNAQQHFLDMLGAHPTSVDHGYRYLLNGAQRHKAREVTLPQSHGPIAMLQRFEQVIRRVHGPNIPEAESLLTGRTQVVNKLFSLPFEALRTSRAYEVRCLKDRKALAGPVIGQAHATWIPALVAMTADQLADQPYGGNPSPPLLQLLLRQALLVSYRDAARETWLEQALSADGFEERWESAGSSDFFETQSFIGPGALMTQWGYLFKSPALIRLQGYLPVREGAGALLAYLSSTAPGKPLAAYLAQRGDDPLARGFPGRTAHEPIFAALREHAAAVGALASVPAARLEQLTYEHLDLCSHRLDAWRLGLAHQRLQEMRSAEARGVLLGAFGWVEDLRPANRAELDPQDLPRELEVDGPVEVDPAGQGFIHAPSVSHAVAAAILRSGYVSEAAQADVENRMAVNLSSRRVRLALDLIDGVAEGSDLGALLGYRFERCLHELADTQKVFFDDLIYEFRRAFPGRMSVDPTASAEGQARRAVVDGLTLLDTLNDFVRTSTASSRVDTSLLDLLYGAGAFPGHPWGLCDREGKPVVPPRGDPRLVGVLRALDEVADALDALSDLALSECVYQLARGNPTRASAVYSALSKGSAMPRPQVVDTPRTGAIVSHRVLVQLDASAGAALPRAWEPVGHTPRADAEPYLNAWVAELLGCPGSIVAAVVQSPTVEPRRVTAVELGLQPIDLLDLLGEGFERGRPWLAARVLARAGLPLEASDALPSVRFEVDGATPGERSFSRIAPILESVRTLLGKARAATAQDYLLEESAEDDAGSALLIDELEARVRKAAASIADVARSLAADLSGGAAADSLAIDPRQFARERNAFRTNGAWNDGAVETLWGRRADLAAHLDPAAVAGVRLPSMPDRSSKEKIVGSLLDGVEQAFVELATRARAATAQLAQLADAAEPLQVLQRTARALFGDGYSILPRFSMRNAEAVASSLAGLSDAGWEEIDTFLLRAAPVRRQVASLLRALTLADVAGGGSTAPRRLGIAQLPFAKGEGWLGAAPPPERTPEGDRLSLVVIAPDRLQAESVALRIDGWTDVLPSRSETTGLTFHYDQPDATPPQAMLLVVPPDPRRWNLDDLVHALYDTLELARNRMVESEHLSADIWGQVLPALVGEVVPARAGSFTDPEHSRVILDYSINRQEG